MQPLVTIYNADLCADFWKGGPHGLEWNPLSTIRLRCSLAMDVFCKRNQRRGHAVDIHSSRRMFVIWMLTSGSALQDVPDRSNVSFRHRAGVAPKIVDPRGSFQS